MTQGKQYTMTDLYKITGRVIATIPLDFEDRETMIRDLEHFRDGLYYKAPELLPNQWQHLGEKLHHYLGDPAGREWVEKIGRIARGEEWE